MGGLMSGVNKSIDTNITDIINHANSITVNDIYEINHSAIIGEDEDNPGGYQWIAALDSLTCMACSALDNKIFDLLPGMNIEKKGQTMPPHEPPLHPHCRCIITVVLPGMRNDPTQTKLNYKDWFNEQERNTQIDIIGPARYREFQNGKEVTTFAKDGRIMTLEELGIDRKKRITRQLVFEEIYKDSAIPHKLTDNEILNYYNDKMTDEELQEAFKKRYTHIEVDIVGKMPREQMQILFREYDSLLQKYPVGNKLMSIEVGFLRKGTYGSYISSRSSITFDRDFVNGNVKEIIDKMYKNGHISTNDKKHVYIHEFAHAIDRAMGKNDKIGRQLLLKEAHTNNLREKLEDAWIDFAKSISGYASKIPQVKNKETGKYEKIKSSMYGGEFFAEAFIAWKNKKLLYSEWKWLIEFFREINL